MKTKVTSGRKPIYGGEPLKPHSFRISEAQEKKLERLGGSEWLRAQIDAAPMPRKR